MIFGVEAVLQEPAHAGGCEPWIGGEKRAQRTRVPCGPWKSGHDFVALCCPVVLQEAFDFRMARIGGFPLAWTHATSCGHTLCW